MPQLLHLNGEMTKINKRLVKAIIKQTTAQMPDVPPVPVDSDVSVNYMSLMKSLTTILLSLREMYAYRFSIQPEGEADYFDLPDLPVGEEGSEFSGLQSQGQSEMSYAPFGSQGSQASSGIPFYRRGSPQASEYSQPQASVYSQPQGSTVGRPSTRWEGLSQLSEPRRAEQSIQDNIAYARGNSVVLNSLTREVVNCQFLVEELPFEQLSKIQKQKLKVIIVKINKVKGVINIGVSKPIYIKLNKILTRIASSLGEGSASEFLLRTEDEIAPVESNELIGFGRVASGVICGSTTSVYGAGKKHQMLSPAMFAAHNVNSMFVHSLSKRNN
jgi:hypothetical protein